MGMILRPAEAADEKLLLYWRACDEQQSDWWQGTGVDPVAHARWLADRLDNSCVQVWIAECDGIPIGQARCDSNGELSFSIAVHYRRHGLGCELVSEAVARSTRFRHTRLKAAVDRSNEAGIATLEKAGFVRREDVLFLRWPE